MTTANKITILRILLVPFFITQILYYTRTQDEGHRLLALLSFVLAAISDGVDGYIARHYNQRSELGAILDPLADKLLLLSGTVLLSLDNLPHLQRIPLWLVTTIVSRDVLLFIGAGVIYYTCGKVTIQPHIFGKIATVLQMIILVWILLKWSPAWLGLWSFSAALFTGGSGILYLLDGVRQLNASPRSAPSPTR